MYVARKTPNKMQLYLRGVDQLEAIPIRGTEGRFAYGPFFSPDGSQVGFRDISGLKKVSIHGGVPVYPMGQKFPPAQPGAWTVRSSSDQMKGYFVFLTLEESLKP